MALHLEITTPDGTALQTEVEYAYFPGVNGEFGILQTHTPLISVLIPGELRYKRAEDDEEMLIVIGAGFVEVRHDEIVAVTEIALTAVEAAKISDHDYERQIEEAKQKLANVQALSVEESAHFEASLARDLAVLRFKRKKGVQ